MNFAKFLSTFFFLNRTPPVAVSTIFIVDFDCIFVPEAYSELSPTSKMELFAKIVN